MPQILLQNMYAQIMKTNFNKILEHNMYGVRAGEGEVKTLMKLGKHAPVLPAMVTKSLSPSPVTVCTFVPDRVGGMQLEIVDRDRARRGPTGPFVSRKNVHVAAVRPYPYTYEGLVTLVFFSQGCPLAKKNLKK
jgi:hypothetical protein